MRVNSIQIISKQNKATEGRNRGKVTLHPPMAAMPPLSLLNNTTINSHPSSFFISYKFPISISLHTHNRNLYPNNQTQFTAQRRRPPLPLFSLVYNNSQFVFYKVCVCICFKQFFILWVLFVIHIPTVASLCVRTVCF